MVKISVRENVEAAEQLPAEMAALEEVLPGERRRSHHRRRRRWRRADLQHHHPLDLPPLIRSLRLRIRTGTGGISLDLEEAAAAVVHVHRPAHRLASVAGGDAGVVLGGLVDLHLLHLVVIRDVDGCRQREYGHGLGACGRRRKGVVGGHGHYDGEADGAVVEAQSRSGGLGR